jgi:hypothetical protein
VRAELTFGAINNSRNLWAPVKILADQRCLKTVLVILLAVYFLFAMGRIVDRIVNVDAPAAKLAEQASVEI